MTLYEYMRNHKDEEEITVWDSEYDMESYFYNDKPEISFEKSMKKLSKLLIVEDISEHGVVVDISGLIKNKLDKLKESDLFYRCTVDSIMNDMMAILSGNVGEEWMEKFVDVLK